MAKTSEKFQPLRWIRQTDPPYYVNCTAISKNGGRAVAGTFFHPYLKQKTDLADQFGTYCFDRDGNQLWVEKFVGYEGVYAVAISGDGSIAGSGGWLTQDPLQGFIRAYRAENGTRIANYEIGSRVNQLALSLDGTTLVAAATNVYLAQQTNGAFPTSPSELPLTGSGNSAQCISMPSNGSWFVFGDAEGTVYLVENANGKVGTVYKCATGTTSAVHSVAVSADGKWFVAVGYSNYVYLFNVASIQKGESVGTFDLGSTARTGWVAISGDGSFISVVQNSDKTGLVYGLSNNNGKLEQLWTKPQPTLANPNSTSVDAAAKYVAVADGYPDQTPGHFYLFDGATGNQLWEYQTPNMNWPLFISADGSGLIGGSDHGTVYYFTPE